MAVEQGFTFEDLKRILVDRVGLPEDGVVDDPEARFEDMGLDALAFVEVQLAMMQIGISAVVRITKGSEMPSTPR